MFLLLLLLFSHWVLLDSFATPWSIVCQASLSIAFPILEWVAISFFRESSQPRDWIHIFCLSGGFSRTESSGKPFLIYTYNTNNREFTNKVILKIKWFDICKVLIAVIICGVVVKLLLSSCFQNWKCGSQFTFTGAHDIYKNLVHNHQDEYFIFICCNNFLGRL